MTTTLELPEFDTRFAPKLSPELRCTVFVLHQYSRVPYSVLAAAFGVHRRTVVSICNVEGKQYKPVHREFFKIGAVAMYDKYVRDEHIMMVHRANSQRFSLPKPVFNKAANKQEGLHTFGDKKLYIQWVEEMVEGKPWIGWAVNLNNMGWTGGDDGLPYHTSHEALRHIKAFLGVK